MDPKVIAAVVTGIATITAALLVAILQFAAKLREEQRLARVALVEADARVAAAFVSLMTRAHARGESVLSEGALEPLLREGALADVLRAYRSCPAETHR